MKVYYIKDEYGDYICAGSFVCQKTPYKVIGSKGYARKFKSRKSAEKELEKMKLRYENIDDTCHIFEEEY
jgi:hypothetical protein